MDNESLTYVLYFISGLAVGQAVGYMIGWFTENKAYDRNRKKG